MPVSKARTPQLPKILVVIFSNPFQARYEHRCFGREEEAHGFNYNENVQVVACVHLRHSETDIQ